MSGDRTRLPVLAQFRAARRARLFREKPGAARHAGSSPAHAVAKHRRE